MSTIGAPAPTSPASTTEPAADPTASGPGNTPATTTATTPPRKTPTTTGPAPTPTTSAPRTSSVPPAPVRVPRVADLSHADAAARLKAAGFTVARAEEASAEPAGSVPRTSPAPGASVAKGSTVTVIVAKPDPTMTVVPNIYGVNTATSKAALLAAGLTPEPAFDRLITAHCEIRTYTPPAGVVVKRGTVVDVTAFMNCG